MRIKWFTERLSFKGKITFAMVVSSLLLMTITTVSLVTFEVYTFRDNMKQELDMVTKITAINLTAPFFLSQKLVPDMRAKGWGRIVNFASLQSFRAFPGGIAYGASKGGVAQLTRAMAEAWSNIGITANAIAPGFFHTELTAAVFDDPERAARNAAQTCVGRNGEDADLDGPLLFLCSDASRYVTGQVMMLDGGFTAK